MVGTATNYQLSSYCREVATTGTTFLEEVFKQLKEGKITVAEAVGAKADALMQDCINLAQKAQIWEIRAFEAGDANSAKLFGHMANEFDRLAADRFVSSAKEYLVKAANYSTAGLYKALSMVGPIGDAINLGYGTAEIITSGDGTKLGEATYDILGTMVGAFVGGWIVGGIAAGAVVLGVPVAAGTIGAGIIVGLCAVAGGLVFSEVGWDRAVGS